MVQNFTLEIIIQIGMIVRIWKAERTYFASSWNVVCNMDGIALRVTLINLDRLTHWAVC